MTLEEFKAACVFERDLHTDVVHINKSGMETWRVRFSALFSHAVPYHVAFPADNPAMVYLRDDMTQRLYYKLKKEFGGTGDYTVDDLHMAYELGARDGMFTGATDFDAVLKKIDRRKGRA